jgi:hypothetical protein
MSCGHTKFEGSPPCPCDRESVSLVDYGVLKERARILGIVAGAEWSGENLFEDIRELKRLIEGVNDE